MAREVPDLRPGVVRVLRLLSSPEEQLEYERRVPGVSVPTELLSQWFDDLYIPESSSFRLCFSSQEMGALAAFNNYFADREKLLPPPRDGIKTWIEDGVWQGIVREASRALSAMEDEPARQE